jgi:YidC/Oxa1 family membrane protein insertase
MMDTQRLILLFVFGFSVLMLWEAWQKENRPKPAPSAPTVQQGVPTPKPAPGTAAAPLQGVPEAGKQAGAVPGAAAAPVAGELVRVRTDLFIAEIDTLGGTLKQLELIKHKDSADANKNFVLFGPEHHYEAQSGLTGEAGPNHRTLWRAQARDYALEPGKDAVEVRLSAVGRDGLAVDKVYTFRRDSYVIDLAMEMRNQGSAPIAPYAYFQLTHDGKPAADANTLAQSFGAQSFIGFAVYTAEKAFHKIHPSDIDKSKVDAQLKADNGWCSTTSSRLGWCPTRCFGNTCSRSARTASTSAARWCRCPRSHRAPLRNLKCAFTQARRSSRGSRPLRPAWTLSWTMAG